MGYYHLMHSCHCVSVSVSAPRDGLAAARSNRFYLDGWLDGTFPLVLSTLLSTEYSSVRLCNIYITLNYHLL